MKLTKDFDEDELKCPCCGAIKMDLTFMDSLQHFRNLCGFPFQVLSGFRCPKENARVGGEPDSRHLDGLASDIAFHNGDELYKLIKFAPIFFNGLGINNGSVHVDKRNTQTGWTYYKNYEKIKVP